MSIETMAEQLRKSVDEYLERPEGNIFDDVTTLMKAYQNHWIRLRWREELKDN